MSNKTTWNEILVERRVTYTLEVDGKFYLIENVPARVNVEPGEQYFSLNTVDRLQQVALRHQQPDRTITPPVYESAKLA